MTVPAATLQRSYEIHGIGLTVSSEEPATIDAIERRLQAFRREPGAPAELRIEFVGDEDRVAMPPGPSRPIYDTPHGPVHYFPDADALYGDLGEVRLRCDAGIGFARLQAAAFEGRALYLATHPLATISLMELLERRGRYSLHAACLAHEGRGVLLAGPTGAGKSTLTLALVRAGMAFVSDDVVFLEHEPRDRAGAGAVRVLGFADDVGVTEDAAARFDELGGLLEAPPADGFPKRLTRMEDAFAVAPVPRCEPRALVFPEVVRDRPSRLLPLDPKDAWLRLVPDVLLTQPAGTQSHLRALAALLAQVDCRRLESGGDLEAAVQLVKDLVVRRPA
jgi:hypothetical protein